MVVVVVVVLVVVVARRGAHSVDELNLKNHHERHLKNLHGLLNAARAAPPPPLSQRSKRAEELVDNVRLDDLDPVASTAQATNKARTSSADEPDRASCRPDREGKSDDTATVASGTTPKTDVIVDQYRSVQALADT